MPAFVPKALLDIFWTHVCIANNEPWMPGSSHLLLHCYYHSQSILPNAKSIQQKNHIPSRTFTHAWAGLPSFHGIYVTAPSSLPTTGPRLLSTATKTPDVCFGSSLLAFSSVILAASAANLHPCLHNLLRRPRATILRRESLWNRRDTCQRQTGNQQTKTLELRTKIWKHHRVTTRSLSRAARTMVFGAQHGNNGFTNGPDIELVLTFTPSSTRTSDAPRIWRNSGVSDPATLKSISDCTTTSCS